MYEWPELSQEIFDALLPFSFITDEQGLIIRAGRSFAALNRVGVLGKRFTELGTSTSLREEHGLPTPTSLVGEVLRLRMAVNPDIILRGHVIEILHEEPMYIFSLQPSIISTTQLTGLGFTIADFDLGTPLIDLLMLLHNKEGTQAQLRAANRQLEVDTTMSRILRTLTTTAFCTDDIEQMFQITIDSVCRELGWDIGHVFLVSPDESLQFINTKIWYLADKVRYQSFVDCTEQIPWNTTAEFPATAIQSADPIWLCDYAKTANSSRAASLATQGSTGAVAVCIRVEDNPVAVLEFISVNTQSFPDTVLSFFSLLAGQIGLALAHHRANRKELNRLSQLASAAKMATLGELAAGVAHEIKNPLCTLSMIARIIQKLSASGTSSPDKLHEQIARLELCVERIGDIVRKLSDFSRDSSEDPFSTIAVQRILTDAHSLTHARFSSRGIVLNMCVCTEDWSLECRPSQVSQILLNLLNNAFDAVVDGSERWVTLECLDNGDTLIFAVSDSGPGIPDELRRKIMNPFFTTKPPGLGVGLGLSISNHIASQHGGSLRLDTSSQRTRFVLELPKRQLRSLAAA
jgi:signal transduction histidine kinase